MKNMFGQKCRFFFSKLFCLMILIAAYSLILQAHAATMIWPTRLIMKGGENTTALWLENQGKDVLTIQTRVFLWEQKNGDDELLSQNLVVASPPMADIEPGAKQMIRLMSRDTPQAGAELTYRVIVDEIPRRNPAGTATNNEQENNTTEQQGIRFQMRYSVPLFIYGQGVQPKSPDYKPSSEVLEQTISQLFWRIVKIGGKNYLQVTNTGRTHVHLGKMFFVYPALAQNLELGTSGYILANNFRYWALPDGVNDYGELKAILDSNQEVVIPREAK